MRTEKIVKRFQKQNETFKGSARCYHWQYETCFFIPNICMLFLIGAVSHIGSTETERAIYEIIEVKVAVCSMMTDWRENDLNTIK